MTASKRVSFRLLAILGMAVLTALAVVAFPAAASHCYPPGQTPCRHSNNRPSAPPSANPTQAPTAPPSADPTAPPTAPPSAEPTQTPGPAVPTPAAPGPLPSDGGAPGDPGSGDPGDNGVGDGEGGGRDGNRGGGDPTGDTEGELPDGLGSISDLTPTPGKRVSVRLRNLMPGTPAEFGVQSTYRRLGVATVGPDGSLSTAVQIPSDLEPGAHTFVVKATGASGEPVVVSQPITVVPAALPGIDPAAASLPGSSGADASGLAKTGIALTNGLALAASLFALGFTALGLSRRRQRKPIAADSGAATP